MRNVNELRSDYHGCENERVLFGKHFCLFTSLVAWAVLVGLSGIESVDLLFLVNASLWKEYHPRWMMNDTSNKNDHFFKMRKCPAVTPPTTFF